MDEYMIIYIRKIIQFLLFYPIWYSIWFILLGTDILSNSLILLVILLYFIISLGDIILRPLGETEELKDKYTLIIMLFFLSGPIILLLAFYENKVIISEFASFYNSIIIGMIGLIIMSLGAIIMLISRFQLNKYTYGGGSLSESKDQNLITFGMYKYIRHPIYLGGLIITIGLELAFRTIIMLILHTTIFFLIFRARMIREEMVLSTKFGEEYLRYKRQTSRLVPLLY